MKKMISLILTLAMSLVLCIPAFATSPIANSVPVGININECKVEDLTDEVMIRSLEIPTSYWNLGTGYYTANLEIVSNKWLYTNFYFRPNEDGRIYFDCNLSSGGYPVQIGVLDIDDNYVYYYNYYVTADYYPDYFPINSYFYNLDPEKDYAVCWRSGPDLRVHEFSGNAVISW